MDPGFRLTVIDYSALFAAGADLEEGQVAAGFRRGKAVLVGGPAFMLYLVFGDEHLHHCHADVVVRFAHDRELPVDSDLERHCAEIGAPGWSILGGALYSMSVPDRRILISGPSMAYGPTDRSRIPGGVFIEAESWSIELA